MGIKEYCEIWDDVFDESLDDELAPELDHVANEAFASKISPIYTNSLEFFKRTYFSPAMLEVLEKIVATLKGTKGVPNVYAIYSLFGGGKTHTLLTIYHAFHNPRALADESVLRDLDDESARRLKNISREIERLSQEVSIVIVYGKDHSGRFGGGTPSRPVDWGDYKTHTVWGLIAHQLGKYDIMRGDDENNTAPSTAVLGELFEGKRVLILMDELVELAHNLRNSKDPDERRYSSNIPTFVERITKAIHGTSSTVVITMPFEVKNNELKGLELWYDADLLKSFWKALKNVGETISPLVHTKERDDIVKVLKKRIFKSIAVDEKAIKDVKEAYSQYKNIFGEFEEPYLEDYYPFHPDFVNALRDIVERAELQKTRDMLALTRFVVRNLWNSKEDPSFIMLWHLDPTYPKISSKLFQSQSLGSYVGVYNHDAIDGVRKLYGDTPKAKLATAILTSIFLRTYYYDSHEKMKAFPTKFNIARMVYEPSFFKEYDILPPKIEDVLDSLKKSMYIVYLYTSEGYYWFWRIGNIKSMVDSEAKKLLTHKTELDYIIKDYTEKLMKGEVKVAGIKKPTIKKIFNLNNSLVLQDLNAEIEDKKSYFVVFIPNDSVDSDNLKKLTFRSGTSSRKYRNTVTIVYLRNNTLENIRRVAAKLKACEIVAEQLKKSRDKKLSKIQREMVAELKDDIENDLIKMLMANYSKISYPVRKNEMDDIAIIDAPESGNNLLDMVYNTLRKPGVHKIMDQASTFEDLNNLLYGTMSVDLSKGPESKSVREVIEWFYTNPRLPFVDDRDIRNALSDGVKSLSIGLKSPSGEIRFVKVFDSVPEQEVVRGNPPSKIDESWSVLPKKIAAEEFIKSLITKNGIIVNNMIEEYYLYIDPEMEPIPISKVATDEELLDYLTQGYVVKLRKAVPKDKIKITLEPSEVRGKPGDIREINVKVEVEEGEVGEVSLSASVGEIEPSSGTLPLEAKWKITIPGGSGTKYYSIKVQSKDKDLYSSGGTLQVSIESVYTETDSLSSEHIGMKLVAVGGITDLTMLDKIKQMGKFKVYGDAVFSSEEFGTINVTLDGVKSDMAAESLALLRDAIGEKRIDLTVQFLDEIEITEDMVNRFRYLKGRFKIKR